MISRLQLGLDEDFDADDFLDEESEDEDIEDDHEHDRGHSDEEGGKCPHEQPLMKIACCPHPPYVYSSKGPVCGHAERGETVHKLPCGHYGVPTRDVAIQGN